MGPSRTADVDFREEAFTAFVGEAQDPIRNALVAGFGLEVGRDAAEEALVYAWEHWDRVSGMGNPRGFLYRVGYRTALGMVRRRGNEVLFPEVPAVSNPIVIEPGLPAALSKLSERQRTVVVSVFGFGLSQRETASLLGISRSSVERHLDRGLHRLRAELGVADD